MNKIKSCVDCKPADMPCQISKECKAQRREEKQKVPGYYDYGSKRYLFAGPGKGGKVFMVLYFIRGDAFKRHRFNDLPIRFNLEESRADLARYAHSMAHLGTFKMVDCVFLDNRRDIESYL